MTLNILIIGCSVCCVNKPLKLRWKDQYYEDSQSCTRLIVLFRFSECKSFVSKYITRLGILSLKSFCPLKLLLA